MIVDGEFEVYRGSRLFSVLGPGDYVGDMSLLDGEPHMVDVFATKSGHGVFLAGHQFQAAVRHHPDVAMEIIKVLVARIRETVAWLEEAEEKAGTEAKLKADFNPPVKSAVAPLLAHMCRYALPDWMSSRVGHGSMW